MKIDVKSFVQSKVIATALGESGGGGLQVDSLTITKQPTKTTYFVGEQLDLSGIVVSAEVGSLSGEVTKDCTFIPAEGTVITPTTEDIVVKYGNMKTTIPIHINQPLSLTITPPTKTQYVFGDELDLTGIQVIAEYKPIKGANPTTDVTQWCTFSPANGTVITADIVTDYEFNLNVSFLDLADSITLDCRPIDEIVITTQPTKTAYGVGETMDYTGIAVTGYAWGRTRSFDVTSQCTFDPPQGTVLTEASGEYPFHALVNYLAEGTQFEIFTRFNYTVTAEPTWDSRGMAYNSWDTIAWYIREGKTAGKMATGDTKSFTVNGHTYTVSIELNDGSGSAGSYYPARTADFILTNYDSVCANMNHSDNYLDGQRYTASKIRNYLLNTVYPNMPSELKEVIIGKSHVYYENRQPTLSMNDKVWLLSPYELASVTGASGDSGPHDSTSYSKRYNCVDTQAKLNAHTILGFNNNSAKIRTPIYSDAGGQTAAYTQNIEIGTNAYYQANYATYERKSNTDGYNISLWGFRIG